MARLMLKATKSIERAITVLYDQGNRTVAQMESEQMSKQVKSTHNW